MRRKKLFCYLILGNDTFRRYPFASISSWFLKIAVWGVYPIAMKKPCMPNLLDARVSVYL